MKQHVETNCFMLQLGSPSMERLHNSSETECSEACGRQHVNNMFCWPAASVSPACILSCERGGNACLQCHPAIFPEADAFATKRRFWLKHVESPFYSISIANGYQLDLTCRLRRLDLLNQFIVACPKAPSCIHARSFLRDCF